MNVRALRAASVAACVLTGTPAAAGTGADPEGRAPPYVVATTAARRVKAVLTLTVSAPGVRAVEWSVYAAQVPTLPGQVEVQTALAPRGKAARELSDQRRPVLFARLPASGPQGRQRLSARVEYQATLLKRRLRPARADDATAPATATPLDPTARRRALASAEPFDHGSAEFQAWLDDRKLRRASDEGEIDFARRAFADLRKGLRHYEGADAAHTASAACAAGKSDYAGLTAAYVAALRANGIPARALCGFPVIFEGRPTTSFWPHAKAEFYARGVGWVPADLAGAVRANSAGDGLDFFGDDPADFLTAHVGTDLVIDTYFGRKTVQWLPNVSWWVKGSGSFDGTETKYTLAVQVEPVDLDNVAALKPTAAKPR